MYVGDDVKTQKLQVRGTPCKCCSRSQQRSSPGLRLRLTPRLVLILIARVWWISHSLITSALDNIWQSTSHTLLPFYKKLKNVSCEYNREWSKLNFASCVVHQTRSYNKFVWFLWTKPTIWLLILSFTQNIVRVFYVLSLWRILVGDSPGCCQGQQDDFP